MFLFLQLTRQSIVTTKIANHIEINNEVRRSKNPTRSIESYCYIRVALSQCGTMILFPTNFPEITISVVFQGPVTRYYSLRKLYMIVHEKNTKNWTLRRINIFSKSYRLVSKNNNHTHIHKKNFKKRNTSTISFPNGGFLDHNS